MFARCGQLDVVLRCRNVTEVSAARSKTGAFGASVFIGAFTGVSLQLMLTAFEEPINPSEWWALPVLILIYGLIAAPFVALGLALFGLPVSRLLRRQAQKWWIGIVAVVWGAAAGKLTYFAVDHLLFFGNYAPAQISLSDVGLVYALPTAVAWWLLHRREVATV